MLPRLPWDKSLHLNYGALAASAFILVSVFVVLVVRATMHISLVLWPIPFAAYVIAFVVGYLNEEWQRYENVVALSAGLPAPHSIEVEDWQKTAWGGAMVALPSLALLLIA